jgi:ATP/maltotriose-dependent transcriptional regulator MalT
VAFRIGTVAEAEADARMALDAGGDDRYRGFYPPFALALLLGSLAERGAYDEAERELEAFGPITDERSSYSVTLLLLARARLRRMTGRPEAGLTDARAAGERLDRMGVRSPAVAVWRSEAALSLLALGQRDEALALTAEEVALARQAQTPRAIGLSLVTRGIVEGSVERLREGVDVLERTSARLDQARARAALGAALRRGNQRAEAKEHLRAALDLAHRAGSGTLADQAREELVAAGARPRTDALSGLDALTPSERRVAQLAAGGLTNREIAQSLFVTPRTVEGHLTNVYAKLGVSTREELGGVVQAAVPTAIA